MKKTLIALAAVAATGAAFAQSSVTIDGFVTLGVEKADSVSALAVKTTGVSKLNAANGSSQIRFRGVEDLGGGLKATFAMAQRFAPESGLNDGSANGRPTFQGESTVGLAGGFGAVKLGRALTAFQGPVNGTDPWGTWTVGSTAYLTTGYSTDKNQADGAGAGRTDGIFYTSPNFSGLTVAATVGLKNAATTNVNNTKNLMSVWVNYAAGPLTVAGGYEQNRQDDDVTALFGVYDLGMAKLGAGYGKVNLVSGASVKNFNLMAVVPMGAVTLKSGYGNSKTSADTKTTKFAVGGEYALSKRTYLYSTVARTKVSTAAGVSASGTGIDLGVSHSF